MSNKISKIKGPLSGMAVSLSAIYIGNSIINNANQVLEELGKYYKDRIPYLYRSQIDFNYNLGSIIMIAGVVGLITSLITFYRVKKRL